MSKVVKNFVGIDISKQTIDVAVIVNKQRDEVKHHKFGKGKKAFEQLVKWLKSMGVNLDNQTVCCMEYTGLYNRSLLSFLTQQEALIWVEMAVHIKRSLGMQRGKNDKVDAMRIAIFAYKNRDEIKVWTPVDEVIQKLKDLLAQRERLIKTKKKLEVPLKELDQEGLKRESKELSELQQPIIIGLKESLTNVEKAINATIKESERLKQLFDWVSSITGIGKVTAWYLIAFTGGFKRLTEGKQLACYCGVAPFEHTSGTTIQGRPRVSHMANKKLKSLLHMGAMAAIVHDPYIKQYYERKLKKGKHKMSVINAVRNKLVLRIVAVVRDERRFEASHSRNVEKAA